MTANEEQFEQGRAQQEPLYATVSGAGAPVILLHGLFGMGSNLGALARALAQDFEVHQLDLLNHGRSPWQANTNLEDLALSVASYIHSNNLGQVAVVGHSLGGKVAMQLALSRPQDVAALAIADIAPVDYPASHDAVFSALTAVKAARPASRAQAREVMEEFVEEAGVVGFLALSLRRDSDGSYLWRFNVQALQDNYAYFRAPPKGLPCAAPALFIYGLDSTYVNEEAKAEAAALFPAAQFAGIADTGHWLHVEKPREFNTAVLEFLRQSLRSQGS
ncbi:alpha/beta fold hydrolase [Congregibacter sp.]|uniref:alpha/beta fold hydrolase n=1 Tax=Congregibacter sp. TaxID=2744308 RepID=UPI003F6BE634